MEHLAAEKSTPIAKRVAAKITGLVVQLKPEYLNDEAARRKERAEAWRELGRASYFGISVSGLATEAIPFDLDGELRTD